ncbi:MAG: 5'/3'-nucleotidase SurE [Clostridia bacterium]|nr:5'/3'-nucleotidase SurE [Clostridia bacterium]
MRILICNDDGIESSGLKALAEKLSDKNEILVIAPEGNRSACSHTLTVRESIQITEYGKIKGCKSFSISGSPADCVKIAIHIFSDFVPDVVISGINKGHNLGSDIMYSGTVAIAYEAAFFGIPSFAFSAFSHGESDFDLYSDFAAEILYKLYPFTDKNGIWNVNFPDSDLDVKGTKFTPLGTKVYIDEYVKDSDGRYRIYGVVDESTEFSDCDIEWNKRGYITITPLKYDKSDYDLLKIIGEKCIL